MCEVKIVSLNVRGLRDNIKRKEVINILRKEKVDIACMQETHSLPEDEVLWSKQWNSKLICSHGTNQSRGVCIMLSKKMEIISQELDPNGRYMSHTLNRWMEGQSLPSSQNSGKARWFRL